MKSTGTFRKVDELGRIVLPADIRKRLGIAEKDAVEIYTKDDEIILKKWGATCVFCGSSKELVTFREKHICPDCIREIKDEI